MSRHLNVSRNRPQQHPEMNQEGESQKEDTQASPNTQQDLAALYEKFYQLIIMMSKAVLDIREKEMELKLEPDEQAKQTIKILTDAMVLMSRKMPPPSGRTQHQQEQQQDQQDLKDAQICELCEMAWKAAESRFGLEQLSQTNDEDSLPLGKSVPTSKEVVVDEQQKLKESACPQQYSCKRSGLLQANERSTFSVLPKLRCIVFPRIELFGAQYTFTEVMLPLHKDKTTNADDCGIYTMHHMKRYDGGEYEDGTTLDFKTGNIKECRWKYMIKILTTMTEKSQKNSRSNAPVLYKYC
ncbi:OLC1v1030625C1 [Oldenlandia corymbosa var. corymbosa]|uniref:OLC1v1030625C1 n=1 Tax=Oldenlandia corymbosa var. corymbosa TaxID=529605 RepID=A0AAV1CH91_OLDCO|nr:OLC1v1030625C1 [Oldenlandia corymbosa var. corymbosa]